MNKTKLITILTILTGIVFAGSVWAATNLSFSPANVSVTSGETFNIVVSVNPQGVKNYTVKTEIEFPADLLEVKSFSFGNNWMPLSQTGYDLIDNTNGLLIKTAGYPGGLSSVATFGIISFSAKKAGTGTVTLESNSLALDAINQNLLSGVPQASIVITAPAPAAPAIPAVPAAPAPSAEVPVPETPASPEEAEIPETEDGDIEELDEQTAVTGEEEDAQDSFLAGIAGLGSNLGGWLIIIAVVLLLAAILLAIRKRRKGRE